MLNLDNFHDLSNLIYDSKNDLKTGPFKDIYDKLTETYENCKDINNFIKKKVARILILIAKLESQYKINENIGYLFNDSNSIIQYGYKKFVDFNNSHIKKSYNLKFHNSKVLEQDNFAKEFGYKELRIFKYIPVGLITLFRKKNKYFDLFDVNNYKDKLINILCDKKVDDIKTKMANGDEFYPIDLMITPWGVEVCQNLSIYKYIAALDLNYNFIPVYVTITQDTPELYNPSIPKTLVNRVNNPIESYQKFKITKIVKNQILPIGSIVYWTNEDCYDNNKYMNNWVIIIGRLIDGEFIDYYTKRKIKTYRYLAMNSNFDDYLLYPEIDHEYEKSFTHTFYISDKEIDIKKKIPPKNILINFENKLVKYFVELFDNPLNKKEKNLLLYQERLLFNMIQYYHELSNKNLKKNKITFI